MQFCVLLNSLVKFFAILRNLSDVVFLWSGNVGVSCQLAPKKFLTIFLFRKASFLLLLRVANFYGKSNVHYLILDCPFTGGKSVCFLTVSNKTLSGNNYAEYYRQYYRNYYTHSSIGDCGFWIFVHPLYNFSGGKHNCSQAKSRYK